MNSKSFITYFMCVLFLSPISLYAEQSTPSASYKKAFEKFLEVSQSNAILQEFSNGQNVDKIVAQITNANNLTKAQKDKIDRIVCDTCADIGKQIEKEMLLLYSKYYTEQELQELITLYQTPIGKKLANSALAIYNDSQEVAQTSHTAVSAKNGNANPPNSSRI